MQLRDRTIVVTGSSGIAAAGAIAAAQQGAAVFVIGREADEVDGLVDDLGALGRPAAGAVADLTDEGATERAFERFDERFPRMDGLLAVAGGSGRRHGDGPLHDLTLDAWVATLRLNGHPTLLAVREAIRRMRLQTPGRTDHEAASTATDPTGSSGHRGRGSVVIITSVLASHPEPSNFGTAAYAAIKGAQNTMVRSLAAAYARDLIRINGVAPGLVTTPMSERATQDVGLMAYLARKQPLAAGPLAPEDIAHAATFLLGDRAGAVTGQVLEVDGGWGVTEAAP
jgi:NAD(P)-dependent dehydrogenase (short-subunit alcohol dehydrogenase family)